MTKKKTMKPAVPETDNRITLSARNASEWRWKTVKKMADEMNMKIRGVLDEMMDDWIRKHSK